MVALHGGDAHLGHDAHDARRDGLVVVRDGLLGATGQDPAPGQIGDAVLGQVGVDARGRVAHQSREVVGRYGVAGLHHDVGVHAQAGPHEVVVHGAQGQQRGDGHLALARPVGDYDDVGAVPHGLGDLLAEGVQRLGQGARPGSPVVDGEETLGREALLVDAQNPLELVAREHRVGQPDEPAVGPGVHQHGAVVAQVQHRGCDHPLAQGVNRRVRDLGKELMEVVKKRPGVPGKAGQGHVLAHGGQGLVARPGHGDDGLLHVVEEKAVAGQTLGQGQAVVGVGGSLAGGQHVGREHLGIQPVAEGLLVGVGVLDLVVPDDAALGWVDQQHLARAQAAGLPDAVGLHGEGAGLAGQDQPVVAGHVVAHGAQAVAVERGAHDLAVREGDGSRAVPALREHGLVGVVGAALVREGRVVVPGLGDEHGHGAREGPAVHDQELEHVVQGR